MVLLYRQNVRTASRLIEGAAVLVGLEYMYLIDAADNERVFCLTGLHQDRHSKGWWYVEGIDVASRAPVRFEGTPLGIPPKYNDSYTTRFYSFPGIKVWGLLHQTTEWDRERKGRMIVHAIGQLEHCLETLAEHPDQIILPNSEVPGGILTHNLMDHHYSNAFPHGAEMDRRMTEKLTGLYGERLMRARENIPLESAKDIVRLMSSERDRLQPVEYTSVRSFFPVADSETLPFVPIEELFQPAAK